MKTTVPDIYILGWAGRSPGPSLPLSTTLCAPGGQPHTPHPHHLGGNWEARAGGRSQQETRMEERGAQHLSPTPLCQATVWAMTVFLYPQPHTLGSPLSHTHTPFQAPLTPHPHFLPRSALGKASGCCQSPVRLTVYAVSANLSECGGGLQLKSPCGN